jgi:hypothetical protein
MADALFDPGREGFLKGEIDWDTATIKALLMRGYVFNAAHKFLTDATAGGAVVVATAVLTTPTTTNGVARADTLTWTSVPTGAACSCFLLVQTSAVTGGADLATSAQRLIFYNDSATNLPVTPNGGNINIAWDSGANGIFKL